MQGPAGSWLRATRGGAFLDRELLTIADIARRLGLPESTVRYYRDRFVAYIPTVGEGRHRRYRPEALEVLRFVADAMRAGTPAEDVEAALRQRFSLTVEPQQQSAATQQQSAAILRELVADAVADVVKEAVQRETEALREELRRLREELAATREELARQAERDEARDERLVARMRELLEERRRRRWWWPF
ncbi:MAG TPA: MerR family transcriptional regulator [Thermaerobacter sp.]